MWKNPAVFCGIFPSSWWKSPLLRDFHRCGIFHQARSFTGAQPQHVGGTHLEAGTTLLFSVNRYDRTKENQITD
jgi:hypothetical protein